MKTNVKKNIRKPSKLKSRATYFLAFKDLSDGFSQSVAKNWIRMVYRAYIKDRRYPLSQVHWAVSRGFLPDQVEALGLNEENYRNTISYKEYEYLRPLNGVHGKWIADKISVHSVFKPYQARMPKMYYHLLKRYSETLIIPLAEGGDTYEDVLKTVREAGRVKIALTRNEITSLLEWTGEAYQLDGREITAEALWHKIENCPFSLAIMEDVASEGMFEGGIVELKVFNEQGDNPVIGEAQLEFCSDMTMSISVFDVQEDENYNEYRNPNAHVVYAPVDPKTGKVLCSVSLDHGKKIEEKLNPYNHQALPMQIPHWEQIVETVDSMCRFAPQLEFMGMQLVICKDGFRIVRMLNHPEYPRIMPFSKPMTEYFRYKVARKKEAYTGAKVKLLRGWNNFWGNMRRVYAELFFPEGLIPYLSTHFPNQIKDDFFKNKDTTLKEKIWAIRHGFISYRIRQYGLTDENFDQHISDYEYRWLRHINSKYREWMEDKITVKYICSEYNACFPEYYYHISVKNGNNKVVSMMDCPPGYTNTYEEIFRLVREKGMLALKPDEGSHGNGFYKFSYHDGVYYLNHEKTTQEAVLNILKDINNQYLITEYIDMHPVIKNIYAGAVNTIRMIVFKKDGRNPQIGNAYMRFGSSRTGAVDNMGAGGMFARIDIDTGRFYDAKIIEDNEIKSCPYHPDTNVKIEGYLPNWDKVKADVLAVAKSIPQMEYFGFDLAITADGLKFPEINRFPDYPAIEKLSPATMDYLLYKLRQKKLSLGDEHFRGKCLFKLPKR